MRIDIYETITNRVIESLESGKIPWRKSWNSIGGPQSFASRKEYRGINWFLLSMSAYSCPYWLTYKQAADMGGQVLKGEKGTPVVFWNFVDSKTEKNAKGDPKKVAFLKHYTVFNLEQCEGISWEKPEAISNDFDSNEAAENILSGVDFKLTHGGNRAFYRPGEDSITMPDKGAFPQSGDYYSVLFHELTHWTGHQSRLKREGIEQVAAFGSPTYSKEELVAEMGAAFLSAMAGIESNFENSVAYLQGWLSALRGDSKLLIQAAGQAQKAADFILGKTFENV